MNKYLKDRGLNIKLNKFIFKLKQALNYILIIFVITQYKNYIKRAKIFFEINFTLKKQKQMKYTQLLTLAALTAQADANCESHVESELATLMDIVESLENDDANLISTIQERKNELQRLSEEEPECQQRYLSELESLSNLVDAVEEENFESFVSSLESRKDQLVQSMLISE